MKNTAPATDAEGVDNDVLLVMFQHEIDYQHGTAYLWSHDTEEEKIKSRFRDLADQCFGIRKSIGKVSITESAEIEMPEWAGEDAVFALEHNGDEISWGSDGEKILSEWD